MTSNVHTQDADFTLLNCDVLDGLASLEDESVHCVVTSPPYWGLRDYGIDDQLGLEPTPDEYVARMVEVFREVRRVLRSDGTCWVNLGDSYASGLKPKDLCGIPWRVAFALQADGWYLRSDIIWSKPNPMPESVTDRPTKAHEYVFLLSKSPRYFFDQEAVREPASWARWGDQTTPKHADSDNGAWMKPRSKAELEAKAETGRNVRSVWEIATQPYPEAHFATYPEELVRRCILAGTSERGCCPECGTPWERRVVATGADNRRVREDVGDWIRHKGGNADGKRSLSGATYKRQREGTDEWQMSCDCASGASDILGNTSAAPDSSRTVGAADAVTSVPCTVLDPFLGSGTTAYVARKHGRRSIGIELNPDYCALAAKRMQQQSLFA